MHMVATNLCVWVRNIVEETLSAIRESELLEEEAILESAVRTNASVVLLKNASRVAPSTTSSCQCRFVITLNMGTISSIVNINVCVIFIVYILWYMR